MIVSNTMDALTEPTGPGILHPSRTDVTISTLAKLASLALPPYVFNSIHASTPTTSGTEVQTDVNTIDSKESETQKCPSESIPEVGTTTRVQNGGTKSTDSLTTNELLRTENHSVNRRWTRCDGVPGILDKPNDSGRPSMASNEVSRKIMCSEGEVFSSGGHVKYPDGVWRFHKKFIRTNVEGDYSRYRKDQHCDSFLPIPGDIMITTTPRRPFLESYLGPNPGGNVTVFVDRNYFERDQAAIEEIEQQMARFFEPNDMIIRYGKFYPGWVWQPHAFIELFVYRPANGPTGNGQLRWYLYERLPNNIALGPPDPYVAASMVQNRHQPTFPEWGSFTARTTDIIIRQKTKEAFLVGDGTGWFEDPRDFLDGDIIYRLSIEKWSSNSAYRKFTVDMYMFELMPENVRVLSMSTGREILYHWIFRGRDVQLFGPPQAGRNGQDQVLDLNGIEPFVRRPIPHWGLSRAVFNVDAQPGLRP